MASLTPKERQFLEALKRFADGKPSVTAHELLGAGFGEVTAEIFGSRAAYLGSLVSRKLQILRDKGYILMNDGTYTIIR